VSVTPNMLPTQLLRNVSGASTVAKRDELAVNKGDRRVTTPLPLDVCSTPAPLLAVAEH